jgi:hypothetical protein
MTNEEAYLKKSRIHVELEYSSAFETISSILIEWRKAKPDNKELKECAIALTRIGVIVAGYQMELDGVSKMVGQYRKDRLKYQQEALEATQKLAKYEEKYFGEQG